MRRILTAAATCAVFLGGIATSAPLTHAAPPSASPLLSCSGNGCYKGDPEVYGCAADAVTKASGNGYPGDATNPGRPGYLELRYSAHCHAAWTRLSHDPQVGDEFDIQWPNYPGTEAQSWWIHSGYDYGWTNMVGAQSGQQLYACTADTCVAWQVP